jgi:hypothetical protein
MAEKYVVNTHLPRRAFSIPQTLPENSKDISVYRLKNNLSIKYRGIITCIA